MSVSMSVTCESCGTTRGPWGPWGPEGGLCDGCWDISEIPCPAWQGVLVRHSHERISWLAPAEAVQADEWHHVLADVDLEVRRVAPHLAAAWEAACGAGRGPDADADADGWRHVDL